MTSSSPPLLSLSLEQTRALQTLFRRYKGRGRSALLPLLHEVQAITGWVDAPTARAIAHTLGIHDIDVHNVLEFYGLFYNRPVGKRIIRVCRDITCTVAGNDAIIQVLAERLGVDAHEGGTSADGQFTLELHPCLGHCEVAPFLMVNDQPVELATPDMVAQWLEDET